MATRWGGGGRLRGRGLAPEPSSGGLEFDPMRSYRLQKVRIGFLGTLVVLAVVAVTVFLIGPGEAGSLPLPFAISLLMGAAGGASVLLFLDWERLTDSRLGFWFLYGTSIFDVVVITVAIGITGDATSELFFLYTLTTILFAILFPRRMQSAFFAATLAGYVGILVATGWEISTATLILRVSVLGAVALLGNFLSGELLRLLQAQFDVARRLQELDELRTDFMSTVSHELRTPLAAIKGFGVTLQNYWPRIEDEVRDDLINRIGANAQELDDKITELLDFSLAHRGHVRIKPTACEVSELVSAAMAKVDGQLSRHELQVAVPNDLTILADPGAFPRVLENLLTNAAKFSAPGSRIGVWATAMSDETLIGVEDEGPGVPREEQGRIFQRFYRIRRGDDSPNGGTGIGLAIVKQIVEAHGGRVWVESEVGRGSTFYVALPRQELHLPPDPRNVYELHRGLGWRTRLAL